MRVHTDWLLTPERVAVHSPSATGVVADLHLGYEAARCRRGDALPTLSEADTLAHLYTMIQRHSLRRLVIAGDLMEDISGVNQVKEMLDWLRTSGVTVDVVLGNHDAGLADAPVFREAIDVDNWLVIHGHGALPSGRIVQGHFHPCLRWNGTITAPCYLVGPDHLVLPAFSRNAAGVNVLRTSQWRGYRAIAIAGDQLLDFGEVSALTRKRAGSVSDGTDPASVAYASGSFFKWRYQ
jgi:putative SbcD/Mre11-related phosphoesterase